MTPFVLTTVSRRWALDTLAGARYSISGKGGARYSISGMPVVE
jgi:hypothetical protein